MTSPVPGQNPSTGPAGTTRDTGKTDAAKADDEPTLLDNIREKGFMAYVEEIHEKKMEELRARILDSMGLTEDELAEMPAEQRNAIEEMIARKIRQYLSTESAMNGGAGPLPGLGGDLPGLKPGQDGTAGTASGNGMDTGLVLIQAINRTDAIPFDPDGSEGAGG